MLKEEVNITLKFNLKLFSCKKNNVLLIAQSKYLSFIKKYTKKDSMISHKLETKNNNIFETARQMENVATKCCFCIVCLER